MQLIEETGGIYIKTKHISSLILWNILVISFKSPQLLPVNFLFVCFTFFEVVIG